MTSSGSSSIVNEATRAAIRQAVNEALKAALPSLVVDVKKQLEADAEQELQLLKQEQIREKQEAEKAQAEATYNYHHCAEHESTQQKIFAQLLTLDDSLTDAELEEKFAHVWESRAFPGNFYSDFFGNKNYQDYLKFGSCNSFDYAISLDWSPGDNKPDAEAHPPTPSVDHWVTRCICRVNKVDGENWLASHSACCSESTPETCYGDDIGRFIVLGALSYRKGKSHELWRPTPFVVVKSLTEGGFWIIISPTARRLNFFHSDDPAHSDNTAYSWSDDPTYSESGYKDIRPYNWDWKYEHSDDRDGCEEDSDEEDSDEENSDEEDSDNKGWHDKDHGYLNYIRVKLEYRHFALPGVGSMSYGRFPDSIFSNFSKKDGEWFRLRNPGAYETITISDEEFVFEKQYFLLDRLGCNCLYYKQTLYYKQHLYYKQTLYYK
ncbi:MAG: hypothetical protein Q9165_005333 [Trypethelium subeluteriae]